MPTDPPTPTPGPAQLTRPRVVVALAGVALVALAVVATPRPRRREDVGPRPRAAAPASPPPAAPAAPAAPPPAAAPEPPTPVAPSAEERRVFGALAPGSRVADGTVTSLEGLRGGFLHVHVRLAAGPVELIVARAEGTNARPPVSAGPYALYAAHTSVPHAAIEPAMRAVGEALARDPALVPPGLRPLMAVEPPR